MFTTTTKRLIFTNIKEKPWSGACSNDLNHLSIYLKEMQPISVDRTFQQIIYDFVFRFMRSWISFFASFV